MPSTTAVTLNSFIRIVVLMFCLASHHFVPIQSTLRADGVEKYIITRSERTDNDVFKIIYKTGFKCPQDVCENSSAWVNNTAQCTCSCKADTATFLPLIGSCGDTASIKTSLFGNCSEALGLESRKISNSQLRGSDSFAGFVPSEGRLNNDKAWCPTRSQQFFEIDLLEVRHVSALATQGYRGKFSNYVKTYEMAYSYDGVTWSDYQDENGRKKKFTGNSDTDTVKYTYFRGTFETRFLRIYPKDYNTPGYRCLRFEVYGCSDSTVCSRFFEWPFFLKSLDLSNEGGVEIGSDVNYQACQVVPGRTAYLDYQLENKWARVYPEIFKVERVQGKLVFKWVNNGTDKNLSGRIVRVVINCSYSASASRPPKTACLIFKSSGQITYVTDDLNDMSAPESDSSAKPGFVAKKTPHISPITKTTSVTESINDTGKNYGGKNGNYSGSVVVIGIAVGCALVFGILIIVLVVFCKRRKLENNQQETKSAVRNPVVENQKDREMEDVSTSSEQAGQSTYQSLVTNSGLSSGGAVHSPPGDYYGYCSLYQSMDKNTPVAALVYQNGQTSFTEPDYQNVQTLKGGIPYASVHNLGSQTESAYEPLRGSDMQNVYESLNEEGN